MNDLIFYLWTGSLGVAGLILLIGAIVPAGRSRRFSDWVMIGGMLLSVLALISLLLLLFVIEPRRGSLSYQAFEKLAMAALFGISGGLIIFGGGFLLSRFEGRRQRMQAEVLEQIGLAGGRLRPPSE